MRELAGPTTPTLSLMAREALLQALDRLGANDRFGILAFNNEYYEFAAEPLTATTENLNAARRFVQHLEAGGGTEMLPALQHLMKKPETSGYLRHIVLL